MTPVCPQMQSIYDVPSRAETGTRHEALDRSTIRTHAPCLSSEALLQGQSSVSIQHNGTVYRLQATKLGKLILTK